MHIPPFQWRNTLTRFNSEGPKDKNFFSTCWLLQTFDSDWVFLTLLEHASMVTYIHPVMQPDINQKTLFVQMYTLREIGDSVKY